MTARQKLATAKPDQAKEQAGASSPHLDERERDQAHQHAAPAARVIHEVIRDEGEEELRKSTGALAWSGLAAGLSMGFSLIGLTFLRTGLPDEPWRRLIESFGYCIGFVIAVLGRQQLFTESTLTNLLPLLVRRDRATFLALLRTWGTVLAANLVGTTIFAAILSIPGLFPDFTHQTMIGIGQEILGGETAPKIVKAIFSGWLIALMVWLLPSARSAKLFVIILLTYLVAVCGFPHIIAGSVEAGVVLMAGRCSASDYVFGFFLPTLFGNVLGGVTLAALLNHAPLAANLQEKRPEA